MNGWLIVNAFLQTEKFAQLYALLTGAANARGIQLQIKTSDEVLIDVQSDKNMLSDSKPDFVLFWDKDVLLAKRLEKQGIPLFNSAAAVEICDSKALTALALVENGVRTPKTFIAPKTFENVGYNRTEFLDAAEKSLHYPMIIKETYGSFGAQVYLAQNRAQAEDILRKIGHKDCILQEFIAASRGRDVRVNVVGGKAVCAMLRYNDGDFRSNITNGGKAQSYSLNFAQEQIAIAAANAVGADFAGVDVLFGADGRPLVCEVNSNPHFKSTLDCTGVDLSGYILDYIQERICAVG